MNIGTLLEEVNKDTDKINKATVCAEHKAIHTGPLNTLRPATWCGFEAMRFF
jgi:hypothetical protein